MVVAVRGKREAWSPELDRGSMPPAVLGSFEMAVTGTVHVAMTDGRTLCGRNMGDLGPRGNDGWLLRPDDTPVTCLSCQHLALRSGRLE